jgi:pyruvate formate lyase activating enzyme
VGRREVVPREKTVAVSIKGMVFDVRRYAIHDGPGIRTTVFLKGCPLACKWCHNPEGQVSSPEIFLRENRCIRCRACLEVCAHGAISWNGTGPVTARERCAACGICANACFAEARAIVGKMMTVDETMAEITRDMPFYEESGGGATFSGGEPLAQYEFLGALLRACKAKGIHTALDTCGYAPWEALDSIRGQVDLFLYDIKATDDAKHRALTGVSNELMVSNLRALSELGHLIALRTAIVPGVNDDDESIREIGAFASTLPQVSEIDILPYNRLGIDKYARLGRTYRLSDAPPLSDERMDEIARSLSNFGLRVKRGG